MKTNWYYRWNLPGCLPDSYGEDMEGLSFDDAKNALVGIMESFSDSDADLDDTDRMELWDSAIAEVKEWNEEDCPNYTRGPDGYHYCLDTLD